MTTAIRPAPAAASAPPFSNITAPSAAQDYVTAHWALFTLRLPDDVIAAGPDACESWFVDLTLANQDAPWVMELNANGELEFMMPPFMPTDELEFVFGGRLYIWNIDQEEPGSATGPSGAYLLPNGSIRYPDAAWTAAANVRPRPAEPPHARPYCPDFVMEIRSMSQSSPSHLAYLLGKMREYMDNGARLGWLIDPLERTVRIYRAGVVEPELLTDPETLDGEDVLPGFAFAVRRLIFDLA